MDKFDQEQADKAIMRKLESGEPLTKFDKLLGKHQQATKVVLLLDTSGSMDSPADSPGERRIDALRGVVATLRQKQLAFRQLSFNSDFMWTDIVPEPSGGTNLSGALDFVGQIKPEHLIIVSDGEPDSPDAAMASAKKLSCKIDVFFVGPKGSPGDAFLKQLATSTGGTSEAVSFKELAEKVAGMLSAGTEVADTKGPIAL